MKAILLSIILCICTDASDAQNWQCIEPGVKQYFINNNGYLRGIRVDSVTIGDTTVYYPSHTPRGPYYGTSVPPVLDSNGGSWVGKKVIQLSDGSFIFDSYWNNSVMIKTHAYVGDSWVFYSDSSSLYYQANVISIDTMTVLSFTDSVKKILVTAYTGSTPVHSDPVDSFQIILSKNNGFVQAFDLYTFPYHKPDSLFRAGLDYFLDRSNMPYDDIGAVYTPSKAYSIFRLTNFINPTQEQLYNWGVGDIYEYSLCNSTPFDCGYSGPYYYDTIKTKTVLAHSIIYSDGVTTNDSTLLINEIPEQVGTQSLYYYFPNDITFCTASPLYIISNFPSIYTTSVYKYKLGIGEAEYDYEDFTEPLYRHYKVLCFSRYGATCGLCFLDVPQINIRSPEFQIFPNPASSELTITASGKITTVIVNNLLGQVVYTREYNDEEVKVDISTFPAGVYFVKVNGTDVRKFVKQ